MFEPSIWSQPECRKLAPHAVHVPSMVSIGYTHRHGFILCRRKLANLGLKEALAPQGEGFRFGRPGAARDVGRRRAPVDGTYLLLQGVDHPFAVVVKSEARRVGKECGLTCRSRLWLYHQQQNKRIN